VTLTERHMGGQFVFQAFLKNSHDRKFVGEIAKCGLEEVSRIEALLTDFKDSPFNEINYFAGKRPVRVCDEIFELIKYSKVISDKTEGAFDLSFASVGHYWRECQKKNKAPDEKKIKELATYINYKNIELNENDKTVFLPHFKMRIGTGGIGKGYAVDRAFLEMKEKGLENFSFNGSGDIRVHSSEHAPRPWKIGIRNPFANDSTQSCGMLQVANGAVATSGVYNNFIKKLGKENHHILNPKNGRANVGVVSASVLADSSIEGDISATVVMIKGLKEGMKYLNSQNLYALIIDMHGQVHLSEKAFLSMDKTHRVQGQRHA